MDSSRIRLGAPLSFCAVLVSKDLKSLSSAELVCCCFCSSCNDFVCSSAAVASKASKFAVGCLGIPVDGEKLNRYFERQNRTSI